MRKVRRPPRIPKSLAKNSDRWTKELMDAIAEGKRNGTKVPERLYDRYKKDDVLNALKLMYGDKIFTYCCYCESIISDVSYEQIEHRMPKRKTLDKYPEKTFEWGNLHLACAKCNGHKRNKYDEKYPILDAVIDDIEQHLSFKVNPSCGVLRETLSKHGITTVEHADLNRDALCIARQKVFLESMDAIMKIRELKKDPKVHTAKKALRDRCNGEHGSLIKFSMTKFGIW